MPGFKFEAGNDLDWLFDFKIIKPRSHALICMENAQKVIHQKKRIFEFGNRTTSDFLIHAQKEFGIAKKLRNPEINFHFHDPEVRITYLALTSEVSEISKGNR